MKVSIDEATKILYKGGVIAIPTETVYGLAADATNKKAIERIFEIKNRPSDNPLICHFYSFEQAKIFLNSYPKYVELIVNQFTPGPISFLLPLKLPSALQAATRGSAHVIIRIPMHELLLKLLKKISFPLAAPSANTSGKYSATTAEMVEADLGKKIDGVLDGGASSVGLESTILDCRSKDEIRILRPGLIGKEDIEWCLRNENIKVIDALSIEQTTPGSKYKHYSPLTPVFQIQSEKEIPSKKNIAVIGLAENIINFSSNENLKLISLGSENNLTEVASMLYRKMFELDELKVTEAYLLKRDFGNSAIGKAISNRLEHMLSR
ncbi:threonylcarbamoyl-AMP synthase [Bacteroidota bacterium]|nr:threonylcarbamoyl-AMP synthase [Bacteroidota bacterium]